jgi:hypothetical protein
MRETSRWTTGTELNEQGVKVSSSEVSLALLRGFLNHSFYSLNQPYRVCRARGHAQPAAKALGLVEFQLAVHEISCVELAALHAFATVIARLKVIECNVFRGYDMVWYTESDKGTQGVTAARAATADISWFLLSFGCIGHVDETSFVRSLQNVKRLMY